MKNQTKLILILAAIGFIILIVLNQTGNIPFFGLFPERKSGVWKGATWDYNGNNRPDYRYEVLLVRPTGIVQLNEYKFDTEVRAVMVDITNPINFNPASSGPALPTLTAANLAVGDLVIVYTDLYGTVMSEGRVTGIIRHSWWGEVRDTCVVELPMGEARIEIYYYDRASGMLCDWAEVVNGVRSEIYQLESTTIPEFSTVALLVLLVASASTILFFKRKQVHAAPMQIC